MTNSGIRGATECSRSALPAEVEARVETIRRRFDPAGMFERDVVRASIR